MKTKPTFGDYEKLKSILIDFSGEELVSRLTDENIEQFNNILIACAEILNHQAMLSEAIHGTIYEPG